SDIVRDRARMFADEDVRGMTSEPLAHAPRQTRQMRAEKQRRRADRARGENDGTGTDAVVTRRPLGRLTFRAVRLVRNADDHRTLFDSKSLRACDHLDTRLFRRGKLHAMRALFRAGMASEVAD